MPEKLVRLPGNEMHFSMAAPTSVSCSEVLVADINKLAPGIYL